MLVDGEAIRAVIDGYQSHIALLVEHGIQEPQRRVIAKRAVAPYNVAQ